MILADCCEERGDAALAERWRRKGGWFRPPGLRWPQPGLLPGLTPHQADQLHYSLSRPFGLLVGTPGTGKTFATAAVIGWLASRHGPAQVAVAAPTGKAAVRLNAFLAARDVPVRATTIHSLLEVGRNGHDGRGWAFQRDASRPLSQRFVVADEMSMADTDLSASLLCACRPGTHVLLVGDRHQLPPVGHGAPLRDLLTAGVPTGELAELHRNSGLIVQACAQIKAGRPFRAVPLAQATAAMNLAIAECKDGEEQAAEVERVVARLAQEAADPFRDVQVIVAVNDKGPLSRESLNGRLQGLVNPHGPRLEGCPYRVRDKVICLTNGHYAAAPECYSPDPADGCPPPPSGECYVANGEMGEVVSVAPEEGRAYRAVAGFAQPERYVELREPQRWSLAYAVTAHKAQGSEWPFVVVALDTSFGARQVCGREWLYTAISRASRLCVLVGRMSVALQMMVRQELPKRKTFLQELLTQG